MSIDALIAPVAALSGADVLGLVVSFLVCVYLVYALLRGEKL
jgi:K+-transporting ATPase KdpF subunit